jgi:hypothetical protein
LWRRGQRWKSYVQTQENKSIKEKLSVIDAYVDDIKPTSKSINKHEWRYHIELRSFLIVETWGRKFAS